MATSETSLERRECLPTVQKGVGWPSEHFLEYISSLHLDPNVVAIAVSDGLTDYRPVVLSVPVTANPVTAKYMVNELRQVPEMVLDGFPSPFVHARRQQCVRGCLESLTDPTRGVNSHKHAMRQSKEFGSDRVCELLDQFQVHDASLHDTVAHLQALILYTIPFLFDQDPNNRQHADVLQHGLKRAGNALVSCAASLMPVDLPPWETWVLAESARRTILMIYLVVGTYDQWARGFCYHELFIEALPLDARVGLWNADSRTEWEARTTTISGNKPAGAVQDQVLFFHHFTSAFAKAPFDPGPDSFLKLLLVAHHGKGAVDRLLPPLR